MPRSTKTPEAPEAPETDAPETPEGTETPETPAAQNGESGVESGNVEATEESTKNAKRAPTPDTSDVSLDAIKAAVIADPTDPDLGDAAEFFAAGQPQRARKPEQMAMDEVATAAYGKWVKAGRPSKWANMPVVTFYLTEEELPKWKHLIRRACLYVEPETPDTGVRVHFGNEFTLSERMAAKIGRPDDVGKTVLMWAAIAKRVVSEDDKRKKTVEEHQAAVADGTAPEKPEE